MEVNVLESMPPIKADKITDRQLIVYFVKRILQIQGHLLEAQDQLDQITGKLLEADKHQAKETVDVQKELINTNNNISRVLEVVISELEKN